MEGVRAGLFVLVAVAAFSCGQPVRFSKNYPTQDYQIWQSDDYPDSILKNRNISDNSKWLSAYAYNITLYQDSFEFKGWHEGWKGKLKKISTNHYRTTDSLDTLQYWDFKFDNPDKLLVREVWKGSEPRITPYFAYYKVDRLLTQDSLKRRIAKDIFAGKYKVIFNDTLSCNKEVFLGEDFKVTGIQGVDLYGFDTQMNCCYPIENDFFLRDSKKKYNDSDMTFSFRYSADTLLIQKVNPIFKEGDLVDFGAPKTRLKLLKVTR